MVNYKRSFFAPSNKGKAGEVFVHNLLAGHTKAERDQQERIERITQLLKSYGLLDLDPRAILETARVRSISIDQIEKKLLLPIAAERQGWSKKQRKAATVIGFFGRHAWFGALLFLVFIWLFVKFLDVTLKPFLDAFFK